MTFIDKCLRKKTDTEYGSQISVLSLCFSSLLLKFWLTWQPSTPAYFDQSPVQLPVSFLVSIPCNTYTYLSFLLPNLWQELTDVLSTSAFRRLGSPQWAFLFTGVWILNFGFHRNPDAFKQIIFDMLLIFLSSFLVGMLVSYKLLQVRRCSGCSEFILYSDVLPLI